MKKLLIALIVSTLVLSGCGMFRSQHAWKQAKQENPLQVPPAMDRPSTAAALTIPPPTNAPSQASTSSSSTPSTTKAASANATRMHLSDDVDTAYKRVGLALQQGGLGTVSAQDPARHTYQVSVSTGPDLGTSQSFLQKHFSNMQNPKDDTSSSADKLGSGQGTSTVTVQVAPAQGGGSTVSASGDPQQATHVISVLSGRLGG